MEDNPRPLKNWRDTYEEAEVVIRNLLGIRFAVGEKVKCITTWSSRVYPTVNYGIAGETYTVVRVNEDPYLIMLEELASPEDGGAGLGESEQVLENMSHCSDCDFCPFEQTFVDEAWHEIHVTVETEDVASFKRLCEEHRIKPVLIQMPGDIQHPMTSQVLRGSDSDALTELYRICSIFQRAGLKVIRRKIECSVIPGQNTRDWKLGYFESHLAFKIKTGDEGFLREAARQIGGVRVSKNAFKREEGAITLMVTRRQSNTDPTNFRAEMEQFRKKFAALGFEAQRLIVEFCWMDDNLPLDNGWREE